MSNAVGVCPGCGSAATRNNGRDRQGRQIRQCLDCRRRFTALTGTPFSGYRFPPDIIALAVRWYLRYRLSYADVAELLAERGVRVDPSTAYDWVREFAPLYEDAARPFRHMVAQYGPGQYVRIESNFLLNRDKLLEWSVWRGQARAYLLNAAEEIVVNDVANQHYDEFYAFYLWLDERLRDLGGVERRA